jgi:hypothetical protein
MRKYYSIIFCLALIILMASCSNSKKTSEVNEHGLPIYEFNNEDSLAVRQLAEEYIGRFSSKNFNAAADMLYTVKNDSVKPLTDEQRKGYINAMQHIPVFGCAVKEQILRSDKDNQIRIALLMAESGDLETERGTVNFFLNPVYIDGQWYLTLLDNYAEGVGLYH